MGVDHPGIPVAPKRHWMRSTGARPLSRIVAGVDAPGEVRVRCATPDEIARWDSLIALNPDGGTVYRSSANIDTMVTQTGAVPVHLIVDGQAVTGFQVKRPPLGSFWILFGPPVVTVTELLSLSAEIARCAAARGLLLCACAHNFATPLPMPSSCVAADCTGCPHGWRTTLWLWI